MPLDHDMQVDHTESVVVCFVANPRCQLVDFPGAILCDENVSLHQNDAAIFGGEDLTSDQGGRLDLFLFAKTP